MGLPSMGLPGTFRMLVSDDAFACGPAPRRRQSMQSQDCWLPGEKQEHVRGPMAQAHMMQHDATSHKQSFLKQCGPHDLPKHTVGSDFLGRAALGNRTHTDMAWFFAKFFGMLDSLLILRGGMLGPCYGSGWSIPGSPLRLSQLPLWRRMLREFIPNFMQHVQKRTYLGYPWIIESSNDISIVVSSGSKDFPAVLENIHWRWLNWNCALNRVCELPELTILLSLLCTRILKVMILGSCVMRCTHVGHSYLLDSWPHVPEGAINLWIFGVPLDHHDTRT